MICCLGLAGKLADGVSQVVHDGGFVRCPDRQKSEAQADCCREQDAGMHQHNRRQQNSDTQNSKIPQTPTPKVRLCFQVLRVQVLSQLDSSLLGTGYRTANADGGAGGMDDGAHVHADGAVQTELLCDTGYFIGCQHDAKTKEHIAGEGHHAKE